MCAPSCRGPQSQLSRVLAAAAVFLPLPHRAPSPPAAALARRARPARRPAYPKPAEMWDRWAFAVEARPCAGAAEASWWERHGVARPDACTRKLKDIATLDAAGVWRLD